MAKDVNSCMVSGHTGKPGEFKYLPSGAAVLNFSLASGRPVKDGDGWKDETTWFRVVIYGPLAERNAEKIGKGDHLQVQGRIQTRDYQDANGEKKTITELVANEIWFMGKKNAEASEPTAAAVAGGASDLFGEDTLPDEIPF